MENSTNVAVAINSSHDGYDAEYRIAIATVGIGLTASFCVAGAIGNLLAVVVMVKIIRQDKGRSPLYFILAGLATCDFLLLTLTLFVNVIINGLEYTRLAFTIHLYRYMGYLTVILWPIIMCVQVASIFFTVLVSIERYVAICQPLYSLSVRSRSRILTFMALGVFFSFVYNVPRYLEYKPSPQTLSSTVRKIVCPDESIPCPYENYTEYTKTAIGEHPVYRYFYCTFLYAVLIFLVPFILLSWTNYNLIKAIRASRKQWIHITRHQRKEVRQARTPMAIVLMFYIFGLPPVVTQLAESIFYKSIGAPSFWLLFLTITNFLVILNSSVNFIVYCFVGRKFRVTVMTMFGCRKPPVRRTATQTCASEMEQLRKRKHCHRSDLSCTAFSVWEEVFSVRK